MRTAPVASASAECTSRAPFVRLRHAAWLCAGLLTGLLGACRQSAEQQPSGAQASGAAMPSGPSPSRTFAPPARPALAPPAPVVGPALPPQWVACGQRDFYRITSTALQVFEISTEVLPPTIRGGRVARQVAQTELEDGVNVVALGSTLQGASVSKGALVVSQTHVYRYALGQRTAQRYAGIPSSEPLFIWADERKPNSFWARDQREPTLRQYELAAAPQAAPSAPKLQEPEYATRASSVTALPGFDQRLFTRLADNNVLYSTSDGLRSLRDPSFKAALPQLAQPASVLFADASSGRYWAADPTGQVATLALTGGAPQPIASVPGVVLDVAGQGERLAVLSVQLQAGKYQPTITVFEKGVEKKRLQVAASRGSEGQPKLDLCLLPGRPWVVVGGKRWLQLLDYEAQRLLSEW